MKKVLEFFGGLLVIFMVGVPGAAALVALGVLVQDASRDWQPWLLGVIVIAAPFWMVVSVQWTFRHIERFLRWSKVL